ncbi:hypothetical protein [Halorientalis pallida]|uniref:Uncharacterized protein n=1 Tax=Halorientalis pallida TaxID=2479928 RepID=A0A498KWQ0_9EURY|nr:hypothetical protein [Halorientalis pallida]RXK50042.1 hypothetical protein EAF64_05610 [Halorientalis pallida]
MLGYLRVVLGRLGLGRGRSADGDGAAEADPDGAEPADDTGSVWDFIPGRQYSGRHAESGGIARGEQERALRDVERKAEIVESEGDHADPAVDREEP